VDNSDLHTPDQRKHQLTALRAGSDRDQAPDFSIMVPVGSFEMLVAAEWLRREVPVFGRCSRKLVRHLCKPAWRAGWCARDIIHAMDHRPGVFGQPTGVLLSPTYVASPAQFIRSRLRAWLTAEGKVLPGYWTSRVADAGSTRTARKRVAACHGHAGARLLRAGERELSAERIAEHGRSVRLPSRAGTSEAAGIRTEVDRRKRAAQLLSETVSRARAELGFAKHGTAGAAPNTAGESGAGDASTVYERALAKARREGRAALRRSSRRWFR
jgi:hypothetical protein